MNNNDSKFSSGFLLGLLIGGGVVFLLGTKTGKNLLKIICEQGMDGITNLLEEYGLDDLEEYEEVEDEKEADFVKEHQENDGVVKTEKKETSPKKRFFKRIKR